ncbi:hypothetical protein Hanom_Chr10g00903581 [Helianthus anomalus]
MYKTYFNRSSNSGLCIKHILIEVQIQTIMVPHKPAAFYFKIDPLPQNHSIPTTIWLQKKKRTKSKPKDPTSASTP